MVEHHVVALRLELLAALRHGLLHDGAHALRRRLGGEQLGDEHKGLVERRVDAAHYKQEGEHRQKIDLTGDGHRGARGQRGGDSQAQDGEGRVDQKPIGELSSGRLAFLAIDHSAQTLEIVRLLIGGADLADALEGLLDCLGDLDLLGANPIEDRRHGTAREIQHGKRRRHAPKRRDGKLPAKEKRRREHHGTCDNGAPKLA